VSAERVSVVIPVRDCEAYIGEAIGSVLDGTRPPEEVVVVDDGSADASAAAAEARGEQVRVIRRPAAGIAAAVNAGVAEAAGDLIAFIDADDLWSPDKLEAQLAVLADPGLDAVFGRVREFHSPELSAEQRAGVVRREGEHDARLRGTMLARRELLERVGPFDESLTIGEFVDWHTRAEGAGMRSAMLDRLVLHRRLHMSNMGRSSAGALGDYARIARAAIARRRALEGRG